MESSIDTYDKLIGGAQALLTEHPTMVALVDPNIDPRVLERFLIQFCAMGVQITEPVDGWIRRAGERTLELGLERVGQLLVQHSIHEKGHHLLLQRDARSLAQAWNQRQAQTIDVEAILAAPATPAMQKYIALHEDTIASDAPYGQVAIELEIERMSTTFGPKQIALCKQLLGPEVMKRLTFIEEHVALDVGHTAYNRKLMGLLLEARPDAAPGLAQLGAKALSIYIEFFGECLAAAQGDLAVPKGATKALGGASAH